MDYRTVETTANIREWQYLTSSDFAKLDFANTVVLVTCSPLEVHGPHLPVFADIEESENIILRAAEILCQRNPRMQFLHLPPIYTAADALPQRGSLMFRSSTLVDVLSDLGRSLAAQGFKHIWVSNFHGGPRHFLAIEKAADLCNRRYGTKMVSAFSLLIQRLSIFSPPPLPSV